MDARPLRRFKFLRVVVVVYLVLHDGLVCTTLPAGMFPICDNINNIMVSGIPWHTNSASRTVLKSLAPSRVPFVGNTVTVKEARALARGVGRLTAVAPTAPPPPCSRLGVPQRHSVVILRVQRHSEGQRHVFSVRVAATV